MRRYKSRCAPW